MLIKTLLLTFISLYKNYYFGSKSNDCVAGLFVQTELTFVHYTHVFILLAKRMSVLRINLSVQDKIMPKFVQTKVKMKSISLKDLFPMFSPVRFLTDRLLLIPSSEFGRLKKRSIGGCRIFLLLCEGTITLRLNGRLHEMKEQAFLDLLSGVTMEILTTGTDLKAWCLITNYEFASESLQNLKPGPESYLMDILHFPVFYISPEENDILEKQMQLLAECLRNVQHYYRQELARTYFRSFMLELGNLMFLHSEKMQEKPSVINKRELLAMEFMKLLWKHFKTEHRVEFYARELNISVKHLSRLIKEILGKTPHTLICDEILHTAMKILEEEKIYIHQIAEILSFSDQAAFCKFFKKHMTVSPMEYRKQIR